MPYEVLFIQSVDLLKEDLMLLLENSLHDGFDGEPGFKFNKLIHNSIVIFVFYREVHFYAYQLKHSGPE